MDIENKKSRVAYYFDEDIGNHIYVQLGQYHPLKPFRIEMTDQLIEAYGMKKHMKRTAYSESFNQQKYFNIKTMKRATKDQLNYLKVLTLKMENKYTPMRFTLQGKYIYQEEVERKIILKRFSLHISLILMVIHWLHTPYQFSTTKELAQRQT